MKTLVGIIAVSVAMFAVPAFAEVTFDPATGIGFVGKGEVQEKYGYNNGQMQSNFQLFTFRYSASASYGQTCVKVLENKKGFSFNIKTQIETTEVDSAVAYEARKNKQLQMTGFNLTGFGAPAAGSPGAPASVCPGGFEPFDIVTDVGIRDSNGQEETWADDDGYWYRDDNGSVNPVVLEPTLLGSSSGVLTVTLINETHIIWLPAAILP